MEPPKPGERREPRRLDALLKEAAGANPFRKGLAVGRLLRAWPKVVGEELAARTRVLRFEGATLIVGADDRGWAARAGFTSDDIRRRANDFLGAAEVRSVRVVLAPRTTRNP